MLTCPKCGAGKAALFMDPVDRCLRCFICGWWEHPPVVMDVPGRMRPYGSNRDKLTGAKPVKHPLHGASLRGRRKGTLT